MALEQRGPPQEGLSLSAPHLRGSWGDGLHPRPLAMPKATHITRPQNMPLAPTLTIPLTTPLTTPGQSEAGSDSEGEYVELEELPSLSPQHTLTQCISLGYQRTPGHTPGHKPGSATHTSGHTPVSATHTPGLTPGSAAHSAGDTPGYTPLSATHTQGLTAISSTYSPGQTSSLATHTAGLTPVSPTHTAGLTPVSPTHTPGLTPVSATHTLGQTSGLATHTTGLTPVSASQSGKGTPLRAPGGQPVRPSEETQRHSFIQPLTNSSSQHLLTTLSHPPAEEPDEGLTKSLKDLFTDSLTGSLTVSLTERPTTDARRQNLPVGSHVMSRGVLCLPGSRDHRGGAVVTVWSNSSIWWRCSSKELLDIFLYFSSISRKEVLALGLTVLVDVRSSSFPPLLTHTLCYLQKNMAGFIHSVLLVANRDDVDMDRPPASQVVTINGLQRFVDVSQLPVEMNGSFCYCHQSWLCFRSHVEKLTRQCEDVISLLQKNIQCLEYKPLPLSKEVTPLPHSTEATPLPQSTEEVQVSLARYRCVMSNVLQDSRLVDLQKEGGASLCLLRREESSFNQTDDYREAVGGVECLYQQVDELIHGLVKLCNAGGRQRDFILAFSSLEQGFSQVRGWIQQVGYPTLRPLGELEGSSLEQINKKHQDFKQFRLTADRVCRQGQGLLQRLNQWDDLSSSLLDPYRVKVHSLRSELWEFSERVEATGARLNKTLSLYKFCNKAYDSALQGLRYLVTIPMHDCTEAAKCQAVIERLESYRSQHPPIPEHKFMEMRVEAEELTEAEEAVPLQLWTSSRKWYQETNQEFHSKMDAALRTRSRLQLGTPSNTSSLPLTTTSPQPSCPGTPPSSPGTSFSSSQDTLPYSHVTPPPSNETLPSSHVTPPSPCHVTAPSPCHVTPPSSYVNTSSSDVTRRFSYVAPPSSSATPPSTPVAPPTSSVTRRSSMSPPSYHEPLPFQWRRGSKAWCSPDPSTLHEMPSRGRGLRKSQSLDHTPCPTPAWPPRRGNTGVHIKGLEISHSQPRPLSAVTSTQVQPLPLTSTPTKAQPLNPTPTQAHPLPVTPTPTLAQPLTPTPSQAQPLTPTPPRAQSPSPTPSHRAQPSTKASKQQHIVDEMVSTEREYVRSLRYVTQQYFPEMERPDLPQELRGQRCVVFGNLENILDFHSQFFLKELEACWRHPLRVAQCFLRYKDQFGLYALYSKNKPKSDALLASHGNSFFRVKQLSLGDRLDLASYLLKPIQRMSKYALLLKDLLKQLSPAEEEGFNALQAANHMISFQLRHGNDLLAMDAIRLCDVNLKEQGALLRQDRFTVLSGRKKSLRHVFLFEELLLFSKPRAVEGGVDLLYKHSFKTADLGLTASAGDGGLQFEVWFRKRWSRSHALTLQASSHKTKQAWTDDITHLLWSQANRNKGIDVCIPEVRMKEMVCMGVGSKPFLDIKETDAAISDRSVNFVMKKRGARTRASIAVSGFDHMSLTSNLIGSRLGSFNNHLYSRRSSLSAESSFASSCLEEDTSSLTFTTTENSGSSGHVSVSSGSDSGCISSHLHDGSANPSQV
ncbi:puratrophin-1 isoform X1 [Gadus morhua]|uniref:puratrophin-1 isoform X1 n=1 Tax=Gadus morhua TaxID=8049 RepID=UPI0011B6AD36|nr:puratrophin-1-like isoform X1 [Gadus morhua]XP_030233416.1 puratrophin-1-like isoform X1 [Gadus morhua]